MGALPKKKISHCAQGKRRSHLGIQMPTLVACTQCHTLKLPHHTCPTCGTYKGEQVLKVKSKKAEG